MTIIPTENIIRPHYNANDAAGDIVLMARGGFAYYADSRFHHVATCDAGGSPYESRDEDETISSYEGAAELDEQLRNNRAEVKMNLARYAAMFGIEGEDVGELSRKLAEWYHARNNEDARSREGGSRA